MAAIAHIRSEISEVSLEGCLKVYLVAASNRRIDSGQSIEGKR